MAEFRRDEEMRAVLQQRTPKRSADLMQCIRHLHRRREIVDRRQCVNRQRGFEPSGTEQDERIAAHDVRARFRDDVHGATRRAAVFGRERIRQDRELSNR